MPRGSTKPSKYSMPWWIYRVMGRCETHWMVGACIGPTWRGVLNGRSLSTGHNLRGITGF